MDGLKRQEKRRIESVAQATLEANETLIDNKEDQTIEQPRKERKSFLDKLTERVKDFLDNAE